MADEKPDKKETPKKPKAKKASAKSAGTNPDKKQTAKKAKAKRAAAKKTAKAKKAAPKSTAEPKAAPTGDKKAAPKSAKKTSSAPKSAGIDKSFAQLRDSLEHSVTLSRDRIQEVVDDAVKRGRMTHGDAEKMIGELLKRGRKQTDALLTELEKLVRQARRKLP